MRSPARTSGPAPLALALALFLAFAVAGCGGSRVTAELAWRFADGRGCADSGVVTVELRQDDAVTPFACAEGLAPMRVPHDARSGTVTLVARSMQGVALYAGEGQLGQRPDAVEVVLYATGGR